MKQLNLQWLKNAPNVCLFGVDMVWADMSRGRYDYITTMTFGFKRTLVILIWIKTHWYRPNKNGHYGAVFSPLLHFLYSGSLWSNARWVDHGMINNACDFICTIWHVKLVQHSSYPFTLSWSHFCCSNILLFVPQWRLFSASNQAKTGLGGTIRRISKE